MRELKFRAWDKDNQKMVYTGHSDCPELTFNGCPIEYGTRKNESMRYEVMQFTGLNDKDGKEIYEGDVVKSTYNARHVNYNSAIEETLMIVEHDDCNPCFVLVDIKNKDKREYDFIQCDLRRNEVVGNIYESPQLLAQAIPKDPTSK